jgi:hypothetical protein
VIINGGFETGDFSGWTLSGNTAGANVLTSNPPWVHSGSFGASFGERHSPGVISQTITATPGDTYFLTFWLRNLYNNPAHTNQFVASWEGGAVLTLVNLPPTSAWTHYVIPVVASTAAPTVSFSFQHDSSAWAFDDVSVSIPEPSTLLVWGGLGAVGLVMASRRRKLAA